MEREDLQKVWEKIVAKGSKNYNGLTREERVWFNVEPLTAFGLWEHYMNHGADKNNDTIEDLKYLNFNSIAAKMIEFNKTFFPNGVPKGPNARWKQLCKFDEKVVNINVDDMDNFFWKICKDLEKCLLEHIVNSGIVR